MTNIYIPKTENNPKIELNFQTKKLLIEGKWIMNPDTGFKIRDDIIAALTHYFQTPQQRLSIDIKLSFFGTSYGKLLLDIFKYAETEFLKGHTIEMNWFCKSNDEDFRETGEDFKGVLKLPVKLCYY